MGRLVGEALGDGRGRASYSQSGRALGGGGGRRLLGTGWDS